MRERREETNRILWNRMLHDFVIDRHRFVRFHREVFEHFEFD